MDLVLDARVQTLIYLLSMLHNKYWIKNLYTDNPYLIGFILSRYIHFHIIFLKTWGQDKKNKEKENKRPITQKGLKWFISKFINILLYWWLMTPNPTHKINSFPLTLRCLFTFSCPQTLEFPLLCNSKTQIQVSCLLFSSYSLAHLHSLFKLKLLQNFWVCYWNANFSGSICYTM